MMNNVTDLLLTDWAHALGWTLLHSLWQSLIAVLLVIACLRFIPAMFSGLRYAVACGGLFLFVAASLLTFVHLSDNSATTTTANDREYFPAATVVDSVTVTAPAGNVLSMVSSFIETNIPMILTVWIAGLLFSAIRLTGSVYATCRLRASAPRLDNAWSEYISRVCRDFGIQRLILLAESATISTPMVIGYFKPMIVVPVGMLTGLTSEQIETILVHELAHIKRHDYLINFVQSVIEVLFFFNPFVRILSRLIREERENCCDDFVVSRHGAVRAYAYALARLAEASLMAPALALPLAGRKNQLLTRIRRIMERSAKNYSPSGRLVLPAVLLIAGLMCISWLGITSGNNHKGFSFRQEQDTVKQKNQKGSRHSRKSVITLDANGQPREEVIEVFEGDVELLMAIPAVPDIADLPSIPDAPDVLVIPPVPDVDIQAIPDTIPPPAFPFHNEKEWEEFSRSFGDRIQNTLEGLYALRESELSEKFKALEEKLASEEWAQALLHDSAAFKNLEQQLERLRAFELRGLEQQLERLQEPLRDMEEKLHLRETQLRQFEETLRDELIEDGYLSENESIETMEWNNEAFRVNGKEIKESHRKKYRGLHDKYFE